MAGARVVLAGGKAATSASSFASSLVVHCLQKAKSSVRLLRWLRAAWLGAGRHCQSMLLGRSGHYPREQALAAVAGPAALPAERCAVVPRLLPHHCIATPGSVVRSARQPARAPACQWQASSLSSFCTSLPEGKQRLA